MRRFPLVAIFVALVLLLAWIGPLRAFPFEDLTNWTPAAIPATASNGVTPVLLVAGSSGRTIVPVHLSVVNHDTVEHTVTLLDGTTALDPIIVPAGVAYAFDNEHGWVRTGKGNALQFSIDAGGVSNTVSVSGASVK